MGIIESVIEAMGAAAEVRCAYLLGADMPMRAKQLAQKSMLKGVTENHGHHHIHCGM